MVKIGVTEKHDPIGRLSTLRSACPLPLRCLLLNPATKYIEQRLHEVFAEHRIHGEWFSLAEEIQSVITTANERLIARGNKMQRVRPGLQARILRCHEIRESLDRKAKDWVSKYGDLIPTHHTP